jgi:predicted secreted hydrolase
MQNRNGRRRWLQSLPAWGAGLSMSSLPLIGRALDDAPKESSKVPGLENSNLEFKKADAALVAASKTNPAKFDPVQLGRPLVFPRDHGAHLRFRTEWWYVTGVLHSKGKTSESMGFQVTFFRSATGEAQTNPSRFAATQLVFSHAALARKSEGRLIHEQTAIRAGFDRLTTLGEQDTDLKSLAWSMKRQALGPAGSSYRISLQTASFNLDLNLLASGAPRLQGVQGFSQKGPSSQQASYYYSRPQLQVQGKVNLKISDLKNRPSKSRQSASDEFRLGDNEVQGTAWMDHEWSNEVLDDQAAGWDWAGLNFDDGQSLMAFQIRAKAFSPQTSTSKLEALPLWSETRGFGATGEVNFQIPVEAAAELRRDRVTFKPKRFWRSLRSNALYPVEMDIELRPDDTATNQGQRRLALRPLMDDQEIDARASTGGYYWEGLVFVFENEKKIGQGYLELTGYAAPMKL